MSLFKKRVGDMPTAENARDWSDAEVISPLLWFVCKRIRWVAKRYKHNRVIVSGLTQRDKEILKKRRFQVFQHLKKTKGGFVAKNNSCIIQWSKDQ